MKTVLNKDKLNNLTNEIWKSAERLRGKFKAYEYQSVILPIIVIRRLECVLISWREKQAVEILKKRPGIKEEALATLEQYRKSLIHECVTGKRQITEDDVQDQL
jgi:type I restriction enzyme M protein